MNLDEARRVAQAEVDRLVAEYDLDVREIKWTRTRTIMGSWNHAARRLELSGPMAEANDEAELIDTVRHELAHAAAGPAHGHDRVWKRWAREMGATPRAGSRTAKSPPRRWSASCCGITFRRHVRVKGGCCPKCRTTLEWIDTTAAPAAPVQAQQLALPVGA